jgi:MFS family permease
MQRMFKATNVVLILLCAMYFISYIVRQSISTAALEIRPEFGLSNTQTLFIFSVFGYPYLLFQIIGGWTADRFGPRRTLFVCGLVWAGATMLTGLATGFVTLVIARAADRDSGDAALDRSA